MDIEISYKAGKPLMAIQIDLNKVFDSNFEKICMAIRQRGMMLKELSSLIQANEDLSLKCICIIRCADSVEQAAEDMEQVLHISHNLATYLLEQPVDKLSMLDKDYMEMLIHEYKKGIETITQ